MSKNRMTDRIFISLLCTVTLFSAAVSRGEEKRSHQASLSVEESVEKDGKKEKESRVDQNGNTITTTTDKKTDDCTLVIEVENRSDQSDTYEIVTAFIAKRIDLDKPAVFESVKKNITVEGNGTFKETVVKQLSSTEKVVDYGGWDSKKTRTGDTYAGYIVFIKAGGEILAQESNSSRFLTDEWIAQCEAAAAKPGGKKK